MRRHVLGPVIMCLLIIGLIGADYGQAAQAKTHKEEPKAVAAKNAKSPQKAQGHTQAVIQAKKESSHKKKHKAKLASGTSHKAKKKTGDKTRLSGKEKKSDKVKLSTKAKKADKTKLGAKTKKAGKLKLGAKAKKAGKTKLSKKTKPESKTKLKVAKSRSHVDRHARRHTPAAAGQTVTQATKPAVQIKPAPVYDLPASSPADLFIAREMPEPDRQSEDRTRTLPMAVKVLELAYSCLGAPYRPGGTTPEGFDCSGFVKYVFSENGIRLGRSSREQALDGKPVQLSELKPGDLIFFKMHQRRRVNSAIDHVGLYVGNGQFIHASSSARTREIKVDNLDTSHFLPKVVQARRILEEGPDEVSSLTY